MLLQLEGAPYWKRFSMARKAWLPLPPCDLSHAFFAGNLTHLFLLDRVAHEVKSFALLDLQAARSIKLPNDQEYLAILAGAASAQAPIHVMGTQSAMSLHAGSLAFRNILPREGRARLRFLETHRFRPRGDGLSVEAWNAGQHRTMSYGGDLHGLQSLAGHEKLTGNGVSHLFALPAQGWFASAAGSRGEWKTLPRSGFGFGETTPRWLLPASPVILCSLPSAGRRSLAPTPTLSFYPYFAQEPFFEYSDPRLAHLLLPETGQQTWFALDPYSLHFGWLDAGRKSWVVRKINPPVPPRHSVLLNWPDTCFAAGATFEFRPVLLGGGGWSATVKGASSKIEVTSSRDTISFQVPADELATQLLLELKVGPEAAPTIYPIPLYSLGMPKPFAVASPGLDKGMEEFGLSLRSIDSPGGVRKGLPTSLIQTSDAISDIAGVVNGHLVIFTEKQRIDFHPLKSGTAVGSIPLAKDGVYLINGDSLIEYFPEKRALTRIHVPDGRRTASVTFPSDVNLEGMHAGTAPGSPLTLLLKKKTVTSQVRIGEWTVTTWDGLSSFFAVSSETLRPGPWAKPIVLSTPSNPYDFSAATSFSTRENIPRQLCGSRDGRFVFLANGFISIGTTASAAMRFPGRSPEAGYRSTNLFGGSITGMIATAGEGALKGGTFTPYPNGHLAIRSGCGRYLFYWLENRRTLDIRTLENDQALFRLGRMVDPEPSTNDREARYFDEAGILVVFRPRENLIRIVELDIASVARELTPAAFHVVSQPPPVVAQGAGFEYQVRVNQPSALSKIELREPVENAAVTGRGTLRYTAPAEVLTPTRVDFCLKLTSMEGEVVLHDFSIVVLPAMHDSTKSPSSNADAILR